MRGRGQASRRVERFTLVSSKSLENQCVDVPRHIYTRAYTLHLVYALFSSSFSPSSFCFFFFCVFLFLNKFIREIATLPRRVNSRRDSRLNCALDRVAAFHRSSSTRERCRASTKITLTKCSLPFLCPFCFGRNCRASSPATVRAPSFARRFTFRRPIVPIRRLIFRTDTFFFFFLFV